MIIPRNKGWEVTLDTLILRITGIQQGKIRAGCDFENEVFRTQVHFIGTCPCGYDKKKKEFAESNQHSVECFHTQWLEIEEAFKKHPKYKDSLKLKAERINMEHQLCQRYKIPHYLPRRPLEDVCTCPFERQWKSLENTHQEDCLKVMPNFWFKANDLKIWWEHKYFRNAYMNRAEYNLEQFEEIIAICLKSL